MLICISICFTIYIIFTFIVFWKQLDELEDMNSLLLDLTTYVDKLDKDILKTNMSVECIRFDLSKPKNL